MKTEEIAILINDLGRKRDDCGSADDKDEELAIKETTEEAMDDDSDSDADRREREGREHDDRLIPVADRD